MRLADVDYSSNVWTIPIDRAKNKKEHRVPLSAPAVRILEKVQRKRRSPGVSDYEIQSGFFRRFAGKVFGAILTRH